MARTRKYTNVVDIPTGKELKALQKELRIPVLALSRMTRISPTSVYRVFNEEEEKESTRLLVYLALTKTEVFLNVPKCEEIVRCRDCKHYTDDEMEYYHYCGSWCEQVTPDGYCAWGERRDA